MAGFPIAGATTWISHLPTWAQGFLFVIFFVALGWAGVLLTRSRVERRFGEDEEHNERVRFLIEVVGIFYALLIGLVAVGAFDHYVEVKELANKEPSQLATVYRGVQAYPNDQRCELQSLMRGYTKYTMKEVWPAQKEGEIKGSGGYLDAIDRGIIGYQTKTTAESNAQFTTLAEMNAYNSLRRERQAQVEIGLLPVLYVVLFLGAVVIVGASWLLSGMGLPNHLALTGLLSTFIGLFLFLVVALDYPLQDSNAIKEKPWKVVAEKAMDFPPKGAKTVDTFFGKSTAEQVPGCPHSIKYYEKRANLYG